MLDEKNIYSNDFYIESYFCDWKDHLSMWGLSRLLQTVAEEHTTLTHISYFDLIKNQKAWVLSRMYYQIDEMPAYGSTVTLSTWSRGVDGLFDVRDFLVCDKEGKRLAAATAYWVVIDFNTRHVSRLNDIMDGYIHNDVCATDKERLKKLRMSDMDEQNRIEHFNVKPSMLDHTRHVNNCEYIRWVDDNLPEGRRIKNIEVAYVPETRPGEAVDILRCQPDGDTAHYQIYVQDSHDASNRRLSFSAIVGLE